MINGVILLADCLYCHGLVQDWGKFGAFALGLTVLHEAIHCVHQLLCMYKVLYCGKILPRTCIKNPNIYIRIEGHMDTSPKKFIAFTINNPWVLFCSSTCVHLSDIVPCKGLLFVGHKAQHRYEANWLWLCYTIFIASCGNLGCHQTSNIKCALVGNRIFYHSDVVGVLPVGIVPTTSSFLP